ncbi:MAG TPA: F0F1 ATP synthase subunit A [Pseudonocardiaceae bacterium]|jgi:F-type H+-transporting ATPase subunit a
MSIHVLAAEGAVEVGVHPQWHILGLTVNADTVISSLIAAGILLGVGLYLAARATAGVPSGLQLTFETVTEQIEEQVEDQIGIRTAPFVVPLAITLFFFILIANLLSLVPHAFEEYVRPPTSDVNLTFALAFFVIIVVHLTGIRVRGARKYFAHFAQPYKFLVPLEVITEVVKPFTLALRLFGNILSGGVMVAVIALMPAWIEWLPTSLWKLFDLFVAVLQAFIFALLTIIYFGFAVGSGDEAH